ncbi:Asp-tRNA(Asn)/Glu-tRNA(Gln) amidotransferase subunit GatB [Alcaligenes ammonioxydans]|jgi:aspartyl-tRNA(Asn)/glutamyl-tRNA(Gln) amidotransferase subunit B|uniref:Aspartyl/glutamyl-tRNA(Asn/Gln) amidotransferase subunit B n=1 Tax=Alcaligenes ammonioxydans TaxID=2582914 RepID=A0ABX8T211_9BURK|nr:Asp-tRNA(Asn)/Glu-tRNA(Gln) amidotransferase subunit GatB [Alcaligenes ammonioxydans]EJC62904.1 aspartyl/glutamyl-tRNA amidotransferase subunit B [Alcaligenes faecalis subsp. faecalis NCIB 8687]QBH19032.1 Asp-tRNA(Asn)/Glu-tRNA(Gln) amidotransferase subunit GatB [Alcaligenes faecalis]MCH1880356.1 Asp-tRNA(Asn)/Glu-tRNA(Gln) amidotransferase subunit GatB [Alcaligenes ammonioxydans]QXX80139.1 Asp-tRNA(Asn)/Glu-tRNA(Gln) amidotransferase subunit GatB [Alcaligenes ammonioxydans]WGQ35112.1 Asp-t
MEWEIVIGLETHTQLSTESKIFSSSSTRFGALPNTQANEVDMALPGALPVFNRGAAERAIRLGLAVGGRIARRSVFERKNYFYPDLPKNYQISQMEIPVVSGGTISFMLDGEEKTINLTRAHLEEDAGKSLHENFRGPHGESSTGIDLNRAGTPLLEIVSEPEMRSAAEAVGYARALHSLVVWLGICDGNMQEGSFRVDANVSVRPKGQKEFGTRCELKNINSFRFLERAIQYEARRQIELIEDGGKVIQETRLYDSDRDETRSMRSKEDAHDYRYFPDPDLPPLFISEEWIEQVRQDMPELPAQKLARFEQEFELSRYDASQLTVDRATADFFEAILQAGAKSNAKLAANWILGELSAALNREEIGIEQSKVSPAQLAQLIARIADGTISNKIARDVFAAQWDGELNGDVDAIIEARGLKQINDVGAIAAMVDEVLAANPSIVEQHRAGKPKAFNALVGQVMKVAKGKANPQQINEMLKQKLDA